MKLEVPPGAREALVAALDGQAVTRKRFRSLYFDTSDGALAAAGISLRLRHEGDRWVQTTKVRDDRGVANRLEDSIDLPALPAEQKPQIDIGRHTAALQAKLLTTLANAGGQLQERFEVDVDRLVCRLQAANNDIELALDQGIIRAGDAEAPVSELELELKRGSIEELCSLAELWQREHGLWLGWESKADRGLRVARGQGSTPPVVRASELKSGRAVSDQAIWNAVLRNCLAHVLPNAAAVAAGSVNEEHIHQLRVALRRLRTAMHDLKKLTGDDTLGDCVRALTTVFRTLGQVRDRDVVLASIGPKLLEAGAPGIEWTRRSVRTQNGDPSAAVRAPAFQATLIRLLASTLSSVPGSDGDGSRAVRVLAKRLDELHKSIAKDGRHFTKLSSRHQHESRKRLKRLRYLTEFAAPLFPSGAVDNYLRALKPAQEALGQLNDYAVAQAVAVEAARAGDVDARFANTQLKRWQKKLIRKSQGHLEQIGDVPRFWKSRGSRH